MQLDRYMRIPPPFDLRFGVADFPSADVHWVRSRGIQSSSPEGTGGTTESGEGRRENPESHHLGSHLASFYKGGRTVGHLIVLQTKRESEPPDLSTGAYNQKFRSYASYLLRPIYTLSLLARLGKDQVMFLPIVSNQVSLKFLFLEDRSGSRWYLLLL